MRAMILAAGRGERMGALTATTSKSLLRVGKHHLIEYAISALKQAGIREIVINVSYCADQVKLALGDGSQYGVNLVYSYERDRLETGGGIFQALPLLGEQPFLVVSADVISNFSLADLPRQPLGLAHLVMVKNPVYHPNGDYGLNNHLIDLHAQPRLTFANIGVYRPELFTGCEPGYFRLTSVLNPAIKNRQVTGEQYHGAWFNVGTVEDLAEVNQEDFSLRPLFA